MMAFNRDNAFDYFLRICIHCLKILCIPHSLLKFSRSGEKKSAYATKNYTSRHIMQY